MSTRQPCVQPSSRSWLNVTHPSLLIDVAAAASVDVELEIAQRASGTLIKSALRSLRSGTGRKDSDIKCNPRDSFKVSRQSIVEEASEDVGAQAPAETQILQDKFSDMFHSRSLGY